MVNTQDVIPAKAGIQNNGLDPGFRRGDGFVLPPDVAAPLSRSWTEAEAFAYCRRLTLGHYENFPVGSFLIPSSLQPAVHSLYAFMRTADDFSDEGRKPGDDQERLAYLNTWEDMLSGCAAGRADHPVFIALRTTLEKHQLPVQWLRDLLTAFKMDCTVRRYRTYDELLTYCRYSANPVGRLILTLFGYRSEDLYQLSDAICTGLQLTNHWQDVAIDLEKDRIYLPQEDLEKFGVKEEWLNQPLPRPLSRWERGEGNIQGVPLPPGDQGLTSSLNSAPSPASLREGEPRVSGGGEASFRDLLAFEVNRTRALFDQGRSLPERVHGRLRLELAITWKGGVCILDKLEAANYDVFNRRPVVTKWDWIMLGLKTIANL